MKKTDAAKKAIAEKKAAKPSAKLAEKPIPVKLPSPSAEMVEELGLGPAPSANVAEKVSPPGKGKAFRACCGTRRGSGPHSAECKRFNPDGTPKDGAHTTCNGQPSKVPDTGPDGKLPDLSSAHGHGNDV